MGARQSTCVAIGMRALLVEGPAGSGKSSLALALIDRGAQLIGDDSLLLEAREAGLIALPHPNTRGLIEIRNLGLVPMPVCEEARVCLAIELDPAAPRYIERAGSKTIEGVELPAIALWPGGDNLALKAEIALDRYGLSAF